MLVAEISTVVGQQLQQKDKKRRKKARKEFLKSLKT